MDYVVRLGRVVLEMASVEVNFIGVISFCFGVGV